MDWANERYVRVYTRDTADDLVLSWEAFALWPLLIRKADRAGVIATNHGARGIAALVRWPTEVVERVLPELLADGRLSECEEPRGYVIPNYLQAQETPSSDAQRKREERERRSALANDSVTKRDTGSRNVKKSHEPSRDVTNGHSVPSRADPILAVPSQNTEGADAPRRLVKEKSPYTQPEQEAAMRVLGKLGERTGRAYTGSKRHLALIVGRMRDGFSESDLRRVVALCAEKYGWQDPEHKMHTYLRPETLFGPETIEKYVYEAREYRKNEQVPVSAPAQPMLALVKDSDTTATDDPWREPEWMTATTPR